MPTICLIAKAQSELERKWEVMRDDFHLPGSMAEFYGLHRVEFDALRSLDFRKPHEVTLKEAAAVYGELSNALDIATDNLPDPTYLSIVRTLRTNLARIREAFPLAPDAARLGWRKFCFLNLTED